MSVYRRLFGFAAICVAAIVFVWAMGTARAVAGDGDHDGDDAATTCNGGSVASGVYSNLKIAGSCAVDSGSVRVKHDLTILSGGSLVAIVGGTFAGPAASNLTVGGDVNVRANGVLVMGCEPIKFICANDPDQSVGTYITNDTIGGNLNANGSLSVVVHNTAVGHDALINGGGGGVTCAIAPPALGGAPAYTDLEDDVVQGDVRVTGLKTCWVGVVRTVAQNVHLNNNVDADPDGNEVVANRIVGDLGCTGESPSPQIGDSMGELNRVFGKATGQCASPKLVH